METANQHKKQYDWLKQYQWQKGQSGNPSGGKKGKSLKTFLRETFEKMPDEEKAKFVKEHIDPEMAFRMAEGNPPQSIDMDANVTSEHLIKLESETAKILKQLNESSSSKSVNTKPVQE